MTSISASPRQTKTGFRVVPCHANWVEQFELRTERRRITAADRKDATASWLLSSAETWISVEALRAKAFIRWSVVAHWWQQQTSTPLPG